MSEKITRFHGQYEFLSNFYPAKLRFEGIVYYNSEAAYQAQKSEKYEDRRQFATLEPDAAKKLGNTLPLRADWEQVKLGLMEKIIYEKFTQNPELGEKLVGTGNAYLAEGNYWHDIYWGVDQKSGEGQNNLGKLLMALRERLRNEGIPENPDVPGCSEVAFTDGIVLTDRDITCFEGEAIVNAATLTTLEPGGGLDGAIHRVAGSALLAACRQTGGCAVGQAVITPGFALRAKYVIHTPGPVYGQENDHVLLRGCYVNCLNLARENGLHSLAFPVISTGKLRFPKKEAARMAVRAVRDWMKEHPDYPIRLTFSCVVHQLFEEMRQALSEE